MATITGLTCDQFVEGTKKYRDNHSQYATSSYADEDRMNPKLIIQPRDKNDIALVLQYAKAQKIAVAIRTGGHQYSGASSTSGPNIQLDLKYTFKDADDRLFFEAEGKAFVRTSVSWCLGEFNDFLKKNHVFVPHGQCVDVHVGGHVQTGGYGQLGRSFGLLGDHVISLEIVDHEGSFREVTKTNDPDLFYAILGGSPGNLGVITHFTIEVHRDCDYVGSYGLKSLYWYNPATLKGLLDIMAEMSDNGEYPRNYDFCISVLSASCDLLNIVPEVEAQMKEQHPYFYGKDDLPFWPRMIVVYAQWVPFSKEDVCDMAWFNRIRRHSLFNLLREKSMSHLTSDWIFRNLREFNHPYIKRTHMTNSTTLGKDGWASWLTGRIDAIVEPEGNQCWISAQIQYFGGKNSQIFTNAGNGTAYSWRDSTVCCTLDLFYGPDGKETAEAWHKINDTEGIGPEGKFSRQDRRVLWGSYGSYDLDASRSFYYEDEAKYERLQKARQKADPDGIFTPNTFCVKR